jgi:hypothetical protein
MRRFLKYNKTGAPGKGAPRAALIFRYNPTVIAMIISIWYSILNWPLDIP